MEEEYVRVILPRRGEVIGTIEQLLGASRFRVRCEDGFLRMCRIPGKFRKRINVRAGDIVLVTPWSIEPKEKGDINWIYNRTQAAWLKKRGYVKA